MKTLKLFPIVLHKFQNPNPRKNEVISLLEKQQPIQRHGNWDEMKIKTTDGTLHLLPEFKFLIDWFKECLMEYKNYYELDCDSLDIAVCWGNKSSPGLNAAHHIHTHTLSYLSAVYYVTDGSPTVFFDPTYSKGVEQNEIIWKANKEIEQEVHPGPGNLILFPSWLPHCSRPHTEKYSRYTISFNALPTGKVNSGIYGFPMAHITLNHYEQRIESTQNSTSLSRGKKSSNKISAPKIPERY
jgi:uncharacterized protein (TIGR02466 family)